MYNVYKLIYICINLSIYTSFSTVLLLLISVQNQRSSSKNRVRALKCSASHSAPVVPFWLPAATTTSSASTSSTSTTRPASATQSKCASSSPTPTLSTASSTPTGRPDSWAAAKTAPPKSGSTRTWSGRPRTSTPRWRWPSPIWTTRPHFSTFAKRRQSPWWHGTVTTASLSLPRTTLLSKFGIAMTPSWYMNSKVDGI